MPTNERIAYFISAYAYWIKSYHYWKKRYDETSPDEQGLYTKSDFLERMNQAAKHIANDKAKLEELLGCKIIDHQIF